MHFFFCACSSARRFPVGRRPRCRGRSDEPRLPSRPSSITALLVPALLAVNPAQAQTPLRPRPEATAVPTLEAVEVRAHSAQDIGFAPTSTQSAGKMPMQFLETPRSVGVVTREEMDSRQVTTLQQALQTVAGVSPVNFGRRGFDDLNIRGFRSTESIYIDGLKTSGWMWRLIPYGYERVEVLKGASSILYGQVQPGGLVNAISKSPKGEPFAEASVEAGSYGHRSLGVDMNRPLSDNGRAALRINAYAMNSDDPVDDVWRRDRWIAPSLSLDLGAATRFTLFATHMEAKWIRMQGTSPYGTVLPNPNGRLPRERFTGDASFGPYDVRSSSVGYAFEHRFDSGLSLRQGVRYEQQKGIGRFISLQCPPREGQRLQNRSASLQDIDYDILATDTSLRFDASTGPLSHRLVAGLDARTGRSDQANTTCRVSPLDLFNPVRGDPITCPATPTTHAPSRLTVWGLYLQDQIKLGEKWTVLLGLRHDRSRDRVDDRVALEKSTTRNHATTGAAGLVYQFVPGWAVYGSFSNSFLPVSERTFDGRPFEPETGKQWEGGMKYERPDGGLTASLAVFDLKRQNVSTADPDNTGYSIQVGEQRSRGIELEAGVDLGRGFKLVGGYAYTDAEVTRDTNPAQVGRLLNLTPRHVLSLWSTWRPAVFPATTIGLGARYVSEQGDSAYPFTLPSYTVVDASISHQIQRLRLTLGVKNLFDRDYFDGAINANVVSPAMPRTFMLSGTYFFE